MIVPKNRLFGFTAIYTLNPVFSGTVIVASFIIARMAFPASYYAYALSFVFFFCCIGFFFSRQLILLLYPILILGFHGVWFFPDAPKGERFNHGDAYAVQRDDEKIDVHGVVLYGQTPDPIYIPRASVIPYSEKQSNALQWIYPGNKIYLKNVTVTPHAAGATIRINKDGRFGSKHRLDRFFSRSHLFHYLKFRAKYYIPETAEFYAAILLADRKWLSTDHADKAKALGIFHLYAVSGLHTGLIMIAILLVLRAITFPLAHAYNTGGLHIFTLVASLVLTGLYIHLIGYPVTATRAWFMLAAWVVSSRFMGHYKWYAFLLHLAGWMLTASPELIFSYGFILSFLSVSAILLVSRFTARTPTGMNPLHTVRSFSINTILFSVAIFFMTLPFTLQISQSVSMLMPINNIIHIAFFSVFILPLGLLCSITGMLFYGTEPNGVENIIYRLFGLAIEVWQVIIDFNGKINAYFLIPTDIVSRPVFITGYVLVMGVIALYGIRMYRRLR